MDHINVNIGQHPSQSIDSLDSRFSSALSSLDTSLPSPPRRRFLGFEEYAAIVTNRRNMAVPQLLTRVQAHPRSSTSCPSPFGNPSYKMLDHLMEGVPFDQDPKPLHATISLVPDVDGSLDSPIRRQTGPPAGTPSEPIVHTEYRYDASTHDQRPGAVDQSRKDRLTQLVQSHTYQTRPEVCFGIGEPAMCGGQALSQHQGSQAQSIHDTDYFSTIPPEVRNMIWEHAYTGQRYLLASFRPPAITLETNSFYNGFDHAFFTQNRWCIAVGTYYQSDFWLNWSPLPQEVLARMGILYITPASEAAIERSGSRFAMRDFTLRLYHQERIAAQQALETDGIHPGRQWLPFAAVRFRWNPRTATLKADKLKFLPETAECRSNITARDYYASSERKLDAAIRIAKEIVAEWAGRYEEFRLPELKRIALAFQTTYGMPR